MTDLLTNISDIVDFNEFGRIKETILMISPRMFDSNLNEAQTLINQIESLAAIVINETPKEPDFEVEDFSVKSLKLSLLRFKSNIIIFRRKYNTFISDFAFYLECELLMNQEKLIKNDTCQSEIKSDVFKFYSRPLEDSLWKFKSDLESLRSCSYSFEEIRTELIREINRVRGMINISQIKVVTDRLGYLTINN